MPHPPRAIVLTFDRLSRRCLSFYGHEWIEAPNLERLAARSVVFDQNYGAAADSVNHPDETSLFWQGMRDAGFEATELFEDSPSAKDEADESQSENLEATAFARLITRADQALTEFATKPDSAWLLWLKSAGIAWPCVATEEFAQLYADELDGEQAEFADEVKLAEIAYAACVTQLDHLVGRLLATIDRLFPNDRPLLIIAALNGESLGEAEPLPLEHVDTSPPTETWKLRDELVHTLLMVTPPTNGPVGSRRQELVQTSDLLPTLSEFFQLGSSPAQTESTDQQACRTGTPARRVPDGQASESKQECLPDGLAKTLKDAEQPLNNRSLLPIVRNEEFVGREAVFLRDDEAHAAIRTREFLLVERDLTELLTTEQSIERTDATDFSCQLFLKPEDVWEINDIAEQHPEQVAILREALQGKLVFEDA